MKQKNLILLYIHQAFFTFTDSLFIVVVPIFLYTLFGSISVVFLTAAVWNIIYFFTFIPIFNFGMKWGRPKYMMITGIAFYIAMMLIYSVTTPATRYLVVPAVLCTSLYITFYWMTRHWFFSVNADHTRIGKQVSGMEIIKIAMSFLGPLTGGLLSYLVSFNAAFLMGSITITLSLVPILLFHAPPHPEQYTIPKIRSILKKPELVAIRPAYIFEGMSQYLIDVSWVLAFFIFVGDIRDLGILIGFATLIAALLAQMSGQFFDQKKRKEMLTVTTKMRMVGTLGYALVYIFHSMIYVWGIDIFNRFARTMHQTTVDSYLFGFSSKKHPIEFHLNREIHLTITRILTSVCMMLLFLWLPPSFLWLALALGALTLPGWLTLKRSDHLLH